ncbi:hypothetical protein DBR18_23780 [Pseudomonas sp. HMWF021]|nr:hypothetical protein DBR18_23780 [Pseudomonas sp. HMWF021]
MKNQSQKIAAFGSSYRCLPVIVQIITNCLAPLQSLLYNCAPCCDGRHACAPRQQVHKCHSLLV